MPLSAVKFGIPQFTIFDDSATPPLAVTARSSAPSSPDTGDIYLDDGTNTASGSPGFRRWDGSSWIDVSAAKGDTLDPLKLEDTDQSNVLNVDWNEGDDTDRTLSLKVNSGNRTLDLSGDLTVEAASTIDQDLSSDAAAQLAQLKAVATSDTQKSLIAQRNSSTATANLIEGQDETGTALFEVGADGQTTVGNLDSTAAFRVRNASGNNLIEADTTNGEFVVRQPGGTAGTDEVRIWQDGKHAKIANADDHNDAGVHIADSQGNSKFAFTVNRSKNQFDSGSNNCDIGSSSFRWNEIYADNTLDVALSSDSDKGLVVQRNSATATANLIEGQDENGSAVLSVSPSGLVNVEDTTDATTTTDGSLQTSGGASIAKSIEAGGSIGSAALSSDPADPATNRWRMWQSDGTGSGADGDIMIKVTNSAGTTKTITLIDYSAN